MVFTACSDVRNLAAYMTRPLVLLPHLSAMRFERLEIDIRQLFDPAPVDFSLPAFSGLTHLALPHDDLTFGDLYHFKAGLASLPHLTHLHVFNAPRPFLCEVLSNCRRLQILIYLYDSEPRPLEDISRDLSIDDVRFVLTMSEVDYFPADWKAGTQGGQDYWARADIFVAKRRRGEVQPRASISLFLWLD